MKAVKKLENLGRQTWLASIGAYNTSWDAATDKLDKFYVDGNAFVQDLMEKGESLESNLQEKFKARKMIDEKIAALRAKLGMQSESRDLQLEKLSAKVDDLIEVVAKLAEQKAAAKTAEKTASEAKPAAKTTRKPAARKTTAKAATKPAAKTTAKPAAKKPAAKKPAAKKPAAAKAPAKPRAKTAAKPAPKAND